MRLNRKTVTVGLAGLAMVGALAGGAGIAVAATGTPVATSTVSSALPPCGDLGGDGDMDGMSGAGPMGDMAGMAFGETSPMSAAAAYVGLSQADLRDRLDEGKSLAEVAAEQGKSVSGLEDAMLAAMTSNIDANTVLTQEQKAAHVALVKDHLDAMVNAVHSPRAGMGLMGAGTGGMMGR
jgi:hypothetical protein